MGLCTVPMKTCDYSCVYCQLGPTARRTARRTDYFRPERVAEALKECLDRTPLPPDYVTVIGEGEPTLALNLGAILGKVREVWKGRTALVTNGSLLHEADVLEAASGFEVISPTVSAADPSTWRRLHRPHPAIDFESVVRGLRELRDGFDGQIWPEVMLVEGFNDSDASLDGIASLLSEMRPDKVFLSVPTRPPALEGVRPAGGPALEKALAKLPRVVDMTAPEPLAFAETSEDGVLHVIAVARFHPLRKGQVLLMLKGEGSEREAEELLAKLVASGMLRQRRYGNEEYYIGQR